MPGINSGVIGVLLVSLECIEYCMDATAELNVLEWSEQVLRFQARSQF
jgi:hypothetical protein